MVIGFLDSWQRDNPVGTDSNVTQDMFGVVNSDVVGHLWSRVNSDVVGHLWSRVNSDIAGFNSISILSFPVLAISRMSHD